jgi:hypothetical protein
LRRVAIALIALALAVVAVPVTGAASEISDEPTCKDVNAGVATLADGEDCFNGSSARRAAVVGFLAAAVVAALGTALTGAVAAIRDSAGILFALGVVVSLGLFAAACGAARF